MNYMKLAILNLGIFYGMCCIAYALRDGRRRYSKEHPTTPSPPEYNGDEIMSVLNTDMVDDDNEDEEKHKIKTNNEHSGVNVKRREDKKQDEQKNNQIEYENHNHKSTRDTKKEHRLISDDKAEKHDNVDKRHEYESGREDKIVDDHEEDNNKEQQKPDRHQEDKGYQSEEIKKQLFKLHEPEASKYVDGKSVDVNSNNHIRALRLKKYRQYLKEGEKKTQSADESSQDSHRVPTESITDLNTPDGIIMSKSGGDKFDVNRHHSSEHKTNLEEAHSKSTVEDTNHEKTR